MCAIQEQSQVLKDHVNWRGKVYELSTALIAKAPSGPQKLHFPSESLSLVPSSSFPLFSITISERMENSFRWEWSNKLEKLGVQGKEDNGTQLFKEKNKMCEVQR